MLKVLFVLRVSSPIYPVAYFPPRAAKRNRKCALDLVIIPIFFINSPAAFEHTVACE